MGKELILIIDSNYHRKYKKPSNEGGVAVEKRHFDAWGNLSKIVDANNVSLNVAEGLRFFDRGYTGHEHLQEAHLIHMNGRLYDPALRSFMMPDNFVQQPENTQNYNRFSYVMNNPLKYTDPSGEEYAAGTAVIIAVAIAVVSYLATNYFTDQPINWRGLKKAEGMGAISGLATFGIGGAASSVSTNFFSRAAVAAAGHGFFQGTTTFISGGEFWSGFAAGSLSSLAASAWSGGTSVDANGNSIAGTGMKGLGGNLATNDYGMVAFGTVMGGASAELSGGNFWQGAVSGLVVSGLNHTFHSEQQKHLQKQKASFEDGIRKVLSTAEVGEEITSSDLVSKYGVPKQAANLITSFTKTSATTIKIDWSSGFSMMAAKAASDAVFKDGNLNIEFLKNGSLRLSGNAIGIDYNGKIYNNLLLEGNYATIPNQNKYRWKIGL